MENKTNEELLELIQQATAELQSRVAASQTNGIETEDDEDGGGDHPPKPKFP